MGYFNHHAIVVIASSQKDICAAREFAEGTGAQVSEIVQSGLNGYASFFVAPDGSKEGWEESKAGDERRALILGHLRALRVRWALVSFPEGDEPSVEAGDRDE